MPLVDLTEENFDDVTAQHEIMILDFWASWCGPCRMFAPVFEDAAKRHPDVLFGKINTETEERLSKQFEIFSIPTLIAAKNDEIIFARPGALPPHKLEELIEDLKKS